MCFVCCVRPRVISGGLKSLVYKKQIQDTKLMFNECLFQYGWQMSRGTVLKKFSCSFWTQVYACGRWAHGRNINDLKKASQPALRWRIVSGPISTEIGLHLFYMVPSVAKLSCMKSYVIFTAKFVLKTVVLYVIADCHVWKKNGILVYACNSEYCSFYML